LKRDLAKLDAYYSSTLPESVREQGMMSFARHPPLDGEFLTVKLWDRFLPRWRNIAERPLTKTNESESRIVEMVQKITEAPSVESSIGSDDADFLIIAHRAQVRMKQPLRGTVAGFDSGSRSSAGGQDNLSHPQLEIARNLLVNREVLRERPEGAWGQTADVPGCTFHMLMTQSASPGIVI
jgi:hypothetical protein